MHAEVQYGIDTVCFYHVLTGKQAEAIISKLAKLPEFFTEVDDYEKDSYSCRSEYYTDQGIKARVAKYNGKPWGLYILVHPTLLLGNDDRSALYQPKKRSYNELLKRIEKPFEKLKIPFTLEEMALSRADITINLIFHDAEYVSRYLRTIKKALIPAHYSLDRFRKDEHKARNPKEANKHSYTQRCMSASYFVYDKTSQLQMVNKFPKSMKGKRVLRLEAQLSSKAIKHRVKLNARGDPYKTLRQLYTNCKSIHKKYLKRMKLLLGDHLRYEDAVQRVNSVKGKKTRTRMLEIMDALGYNNANLSNVVEKLELKPGAVDKAFKKFAELGFSPITVPNAEGEALPCIRKLLNL